MAHFPALRNPTARKVVRLARLQGVSDARHEAVRRARQTSYFVEVPLTPALLGALSHASDRDLPDTACDRKALLRGLFMGWGSVNAPSSRPHLELQVPRPAWVPLVTALLAEHGVRAGASERNGRRLVYVKDGDGIVRILSLMGASRAVIEFENARVVREVAGQVNRRLNFETANLTKTIGSATRQVAAVEMLDRTGRLKALPPALREIASARRAHPDLNLTELALRLHLSKSAVNHRLRRLLELTAADASTAALRHR
ncbi:MAG: DNA-binding protein WhiA [Candidatus Dormibacteraeota bacterium]|nr:DNA-binding protein WhiA [Candidatus Dormibacteraeota bacterium]